MSITIITSELTKELVEKLPLNLTKTVSELLDIYNPEFISGSYGKACALNNMITFLRFRTNLLTSGYIAPRTVALLRNEGKTD